MKTAELKVIPKMEMMNIQIPVEMTIDETIHICNMISNLLTVMKQQKPSFDTEYCWDCEKEPEYMDPERIMYLLFRISYDYRFKRKGEKHKVYSGGCLVSAFATTEYDDHVIRKVHIKTRYGDELNEWLDGKITLGEAIRKLCECPLTFKEYGE